ncbi:DUF3098 domain-containing protein [Hymenobacter perfusus]|uniref:DUF3098 domain-containing protein n=1 Tax=Hymenobacter perfusus TaxID=1236770 RepID=A0A428KGP2_9BACT|nr:DUF3098 domain-containing protein [Hymenobacter perfusus]RSK45641.1 DUF3098 domain-containing protein [Hymenobacter perfusus]
MEPNTPRFAFGPRNYRLMFIGLAVLAAGFITMTLDTEDYGEGFLGITLGPILLAVGFVIEFWAIMTRSGAAAPIARDAATVTTVPSQAAPATPVITTPTYKR